MILIVKIYSVTLVFLFGIMNTSPYKPVSSEILFKLVSDFEIGIPAGILAGNLN
jgi:hypothetical protein